MCKVTDALGILAEHVEEAAKWAGATRRDEASEALYCVAECVRATIAEMEVSASE